MAQKFTLPDISRPVVDRATGLMDPQWYRVFEVLEPVLEALNTAVDGIPDEEAIQAQIDRLSNRIQATNEGLSDFGNVDFTAGTGLTGGGSLSAASMGPSPIPFSLAPIATGDFLGNLTGVSAAPVPTPFIFTNLTDVPSSYTGKTLQFVRVKAGENGLEFYQIPVVGSLLYQSTAGVFSSVTIGTGLSFSGGTLSATGGGGSGGAYVPLTDGSQPPNLINDGAGHLILVAYAP